MNTLWVQNQKYLSMVCPMLTCVSDSTFFTHYWTTHCSVDSSLKNKKINFYFKIILDLQKLYSFLCEAVILTVMIMIIKIKVLKINPEKG